MTNNEEVEKVANIIQEHIPVATKMRVHELAAWHIREKQIAVLEARIDELKRRRKCVRYGQIVNILDIRAEARIAHIKSQLTALKKDKG